MTAKIVYSVQRLGPSGKVYMRRIGTAHVSEDGSITVKLEGPQTCEEMLIMDYIERTGDAP